MTTSKGSTEAANAKAQLEAFIKKFSASDQKLIRSVRTAVQKRFPSANELVWDNYNFFVIGYSPTERPSDAIVTIAARANGVGLCFVNGAKLPDPKKLLQGAGKQTRFIRVESAQTIADPDIEKLIAAAIAQARTKLPIAGVVSSLSGQSRQSSVLAKRHLNDACTHSIRSRSAANSFAA